MNCKEIAENYAQAAEIVKIEERGKTRLFIIICILGFALIFESAYIIYDRKKDSEFMIESTEIVQDGRVNGIVEEKDKAHCYYLTIYQNRVTI